MIRPRFIPRYPGRRGAKGSETSGPFFIMGHNVYILYAVRFDKYYIGETEDIQKRMLFHNALSENSYTSKYRPWIVYASFEVKDRSMARKIEKYLKKKPRKFIERIADDKELVTWIQEKYLAD